jgi:hypothetical protein
MVGHSDLVEVVATSDARVIVLQAKDVEPTSHQSFGEASASGLDPLPRFSCDLDSHVIDSHSTLLAIRLLELHAQQAQQH